MSTVRFFGFGILFGFLLSRVGATAFDAIANMFLLEDLHLAGVIGVAIIVAGIGLRLMARTGGSTLATTISPKPPKDGNAIGGVIFGAGWALTGTCPGTGLAQLGEGQLMAVFTIAGMLLGAWLFRRVGGRVERGLSALRAARGFGRRHPFAHPSA